MSATDSNAPGLGDGHTDINTVYTTMDADGIPTATWADSGRDKPATVDQVSEVLGVAQENVPVAVGVVEMLHMANEAELDSPEWWVTLNSVNRDLMGADTAIITRP